MVTENKSQKTRTQKVFPCASFSSTAGPSLGVSSFEFEGLENKGYLILRSLSIPAWVSQVLHCRDHPDSPGNTSISCITQKPLSEWVTLDLGQIRSFIGQPGLRFIAAKRRYGVLRQSVLDMIRFWVILVVPMWSSLIGPWIFVVFAVTNASISLRTRET